MGQTLGREDLPRLCSFLLALWQRRMLNYFWKMDMKRCELNGCERQREVLMVKALNVAPEAQAVLARDEVWSRNLQSGGMGRLEANAPWEVCESRLGSSTYLLLYLQRGAGQISLSLLGFIQTFPVTLQKMFILVSRDTLKCVC